MTYNELNGLLSEPRLYTLPILGIISPLIVIELVDKFPLITELPETVIPLEKDGAERGA